jgi:hypothetical protein
MDGKLINFPNICYTCSSEWSQFSSELFCFISLMILIMSECWALAFSVHMCMTPWCTCVHVHTPPPVVYGFSWNFICLLCRGGLHHLRALCFYIFCHCWYYGRMFLQTSDVEATLLPLNVEVWNFVWL